MVGDALEDQLSLSSTLPRTLHALLLQPGRITRDYLDGRIARYVPPLRLYLVASFVFFFIMSLFGGGNGVVEISTSGEGDVVPDTTAQSAAVGDTAVVVATVDTAVSGERRSTDANVLRYLPGIVRDRLEPRWVMLEDMSTEERQRVFTREYMARVPIAIFLLVPLFAALLGLLYLRGGYYHVDHFIFALHVHAFAFLLLTVARITGGLGLLRIALPLWLLVYMVLAIRRVYGQSWPRILAKVGLLSFAYMIMFAICVFGTMLATMLWMPV